MDPWVVEVLRRGHLIPFLFIPPLSQVPIPFYSSPTSTKGIALQGEISSLVEKGAVKLAPPSPGFYGRMFVILKALCSWRPIIDLSVLNKFIHQTSLSVLGAIQRDDWMFSIVLKDACLQVPIHQESREYLRFVAFNKVFQFRVLCFGLSTAPQIFTMAPVSAVLHRLGVRILRYLDSGLVLASSRVEALRARDIILNLYQDLGIIMSFD